MRRRSVVLVLVIVVGYSLYGGMFIAAGAIHEAFSADSAISPNEADGFERAGGPGSNSAANPGGEPFAFEEVHAGLNYSYQSAGPNTATLWYAGTYATDYNGDRWTDLLAVGDHTPVLFENVNGSFEPSGALPDVNYRHLATGDPLDGKVQAALWVDYNVDGREDLVLLPRGLPPLLLENTGGSFELRRTGFERRMDNPMGATTADFDRDGCPDLLVYQMGDWTERIPVGFENFSAPINDDNGNPDHLYWGTCSGFEPASETGIRGTRWTLGSSAVDLDADGYPDIHQIHDYNHDVVYMNRGNGTFEQVVLPNRTNRNGMSTEIADVTGSGRPDIYVTNIYYRDAVAQRLNPGLRIRAEGNNLVTRLSGGEFVERADQYGIVRGGWGWAAVIADLDNDADEDLFHTTRRMEFDRRDAIFSQQAIEHLRNKSYYSYPAVWERTNVTSFRPVDPEDSGFTPTNGRGVARLDYDRDGDSDLIVGGIDAFRVYENRMENGGNAIQVRVLGSNGSRTTAYGATVTVTMAATGNSQTRRVHARTDYLSQDARLVHVGVGNATRVDVRVVWPDGTERRFENRAVDRRLVVTPDGIVRTIALDGS